jgi:hypothetical protein
MLSRNILTSFSFAYARVEELTVWRSDGGWGSVQGSRRWDKERMGDGKKMGEEEGVRRGQRRRGDEEVGLKARGS